MKRSDYQYLRPPNVTLNWYQLHQMGIEKYHGIGDLENITPFYDYEAYFYDCALDGKDLPILFAIVLDCGYKKEVIITDYYGLRNFRNAVSND